MTMFVCQSREGSLWGLARYSLRFGLLRSGLFVGADLRTQGLIRKAMSHGASLDASPGEERRDGLGQTESAAGKALNITWPVHPAACQTFPDHLLCARSPRVLRWTSQCAVGNRTLPLEQGKLPLCTGQ